MTEAEALVAEGVTVSFGGVRALRDVDVAFPAGHICGLIGPNGAGKTTLFDCLSGVRSVTAGRVRLFGEDITDRSASWRARHGVRRTFQRQQAFAHLTVEENLLVALEWRGGGGGLAGDALRLPPRRRRERARRERVDEAVERSGLSGVRGALAGTLPIATARVVELARAIVDPPRVLLLDEPTSGLDVSETERLGHLVREACAEYRCTVVVVEHDVAFLMRHAAHIVVLDLGKVIAAGTPADVRDDPLVREAYLGVPERGRRMGIE